MIHKNTLIVCKFNKNKWINKKNYKKVSNYACIAQKKCYFCSEVSMDLPLLTLKRIAL